MVRKRSCKATIVGPDVLPLHGGQFEYKIPREYKLSFGETKKIRPCSYFSELISSKVRWFIDRNKNVYFPWPEVALLLSKRPNAVARALSQLGLKPSATIMIQEWSVEKNKPTLQTMKALTRSGMTDMFKSAAALNDRGRKRGNWPGVDELREVVLEKWLPHIDAVIAENSTLDIDFNEKYGEYMNQVSSTPEADLIASRAVKSRKRAKRSRHSDDENDDEIDDDIQHNGSNDNDDDIESNEGDSDTDGKSEKSTASASSSPRSDHCSDDDDGDDIKSVNSTASDSKSTDSTKPFRVIVKPKRKLPPLTITTTPAINSTISSARARCAVKSTVTSSSLPKRFAMKREDDDERPTSPISPNSQLTIVPSLEVDADPLNYTPLSSSSSSESSAVPAIIKIEHPYPGSHSSSNGVSTSSCSTACNMSPLRRNPRAAHSPQSIPSCTGGVGGVNTVASSLINNSEKNHRPDISLLSSSSSSSSLIPLPEGMLSPRAPIPPPPPILSPSVIAALLATHNNKNNTTTFSTTWSMTSPTAYTAALSWIQALAAMRPLIHQTTLSQHSSPPSSPFILPSTITPPTRLSTPAAATSQWRNYSRSLSSSTLDCADATNISNVSSLTGKCNEVDNEVDAQIAEQYIN